MIFATVGTQLPFDRLLLGLESWAERNPGIPVFAQTGSTRQRFPRIETVETLGQAEFRARFDAARFVVRMPGWAQSCRLPKSGNP